MPYFDESEDVQTRIGKVIGDIFAALIYLAIIALCIDIALRVV